MIPETDLALVGAAVLGAIVGASITAIAVFVIHRRRIRRRDAHLYEIPPFLSGVSNPATSAGGNPSTDWVEVHPAPGRAKR